MATHSTPRPYDIVLYGASGFVGRQTVAYLARHGQGVRWALAGRSHDRLLAVRDAAGPGAASAGILLADARDAAALDALAAQTAVVLSTAGPFALHGSHLVGACVRHRTHYVDITGETPWVRAMIDAHHAQALREGTRIVPCCGFDSVPSDLGTWWITHALHARTGEACTEVAAAFSMRGGFNGGTVASLLNIAESGQTRAFADPFLLNPPGTRPVSDTGHHDPRWPRRDAHFKAWLGAFLMGPINTRVVRRSTELLRAHEPGVRSPGFRYQEYQRFGRGLRAASMAWGLAAASGLAQLALRTRPGRRAIERAMPSPGEGPSDAQMDGGGFRCELVARGASGGAVRGRVSTQGDPGNRATTLFVCEAALALVRDHAALPAMAGVLTPAAAFGSVLVQRLQARGVAFELLAP